MLIKIPFSLNCDTSNLDALRHNSALKFFGYKASEQKITLASALGNGFIRYYQLAKGLSVVVSSQELFQPVSFIKECGANNKLVLLFDLSTPGSEYAINNNKQIIGASDIINKVFIFSNAMRFIIQPSLNAVNKRLWLVMDKDWFVAKTKFMSPEAYEQATHFFNFDNFFDQGNLTLNEIKAAKKIIDYPFDKTPDPARFFDLNAYANELISYFLKERLSIDHGFDFQVNIPELAKIIEMRDYVKENILNKKNICLNKLCRQFHITESTFQRNLKKYFKSNYIDFYNGERLKKAYEILREKKAVTIHDVAHSLGYKNVQYFSRRFKDAFNVYPSDVKKHA